MKLSWEAGVRRKLYLSVQSSRFPSGVHLLLPINRADFQGYRHRYIQLPFEVQDGDDLSFELIDDNLMSAEQEQLVLTACRVGGFCLHMGNAFVQPQLDRIVAPNADAASKMIAEETVLSLRDSPFRNFGTSTFIVEPSRPTTPHAANPVDLLDRSNYSRGHVKVYYPPYPLPEQFWSVLAD
jgi:hypothetical protein